MTPAMPEAVEIAPARLTLRFDDGVLELPAGLLRSRCHCTDCRRHAPSGTNVSLVNATPIGAYGLQLHFSDGHERGIFPWAYLVALKAQPTACFRPGNTLPTLAVT